MRCVLVTKPRFFAANSAAIHAAADHMKHQPDQGPARTSGGGAWHRRMTIERYQPAGGLLDRRRVANFGVSQPRPDVAVIPSSTGQAHMMSGFVLDVTASAALCHLQAQQRENAVSVSACRRAQDVRSAFWAFGEIAAGSPRSRRLGSVWRGANRKACAARRAWL